MHPQLEAIVTEFRNGSERLHRLADVVAPERWAQRPGPERWSVAECVAHLNLTTGAFRPLVLDALERGRRLQESSAVPSAGRHSRGLLGGLLWRVLSRPGKFRTKTTAAFVPHQPGSAAELVAEFDRLQDEQIAWVMAADGLPLGAVKLASPFNARVRYNLFATLSILARHQQRHLWQAEEAARAAPASSR